MFPDCSVRVNPRCYNQEVISYCLKEDNRHYAEFNKTNQQYWKGMTIIGLGGAALLILLMRL
ncbi:hypothetical protein [Faecalibaculum rodentium]|uniref:Uncharacterized protein n=1 Tax=Faecalibaculum rodentium TaxID=1702221 RepID=A0A140DUG3_9FIRM|nr:hypothetical protein [Faecalibaculum rodentium]AMK54290.1 hypothetical protein AALO17_11560 [Faecalibaculum rodentium]